MYSRKLYYFASFVLVLAAAGTALGIDPLQQDEGPDGIVSVEAENFDANVEVNGDTWQLTGPTGGFTGEWGMWAPNGQGGGGSNYATDSERLEYQINFVKTGPHYVWILAWGESGTDDSCHAGLDGEATPLSDNLSGWSNSYSWENGRYQRDERAQIDIPTTGLHTLNIWVREDGLVVDKIVLTTNPDYTPTGAGPPESFRGPQLKAYNPTPADGTQHLETWINLTWTTGDTAVSHDVYMGTNFEDVNNGVADTFQINQTTDFFVAGFPGMAFPDGLIPGTTYYWRVDEIEADGTKHIGDVWSFWIPSTNAFSPGPSDGARFVDLETTLTWEAGFGAKLHNIVFGDNLNEVENAPAGSPTSDTSFDPGTLEKGKTYYWRVDEFNPPTTVKGDVWSFTTMPDIPIVDPNLVAWYKFEVGEGTKVIDFSGHDNHGDIVAGPSGTVLWVPGQFNIAVEFLGDNLGHVELPPGMVTSASGSTMMWINTDQTGNEGMFWYGTETNGDGFGDQNEIHIHVGDPGNLGFHIEGATDVGLGGPQIAGEGWNHVAVTWDTVDGCRLYFNGAEVDFQAHNNTVVDLAVIRLGRPVDTGNGNRYYDGLMDDVRLFDHAITADQINEIMTKGEDPRRAGAPSPRNGALVGIDEALPLSWSPGDEAVSHEVYFGTEKEAVANADTSDSTGVYRGNQNATTFTPSEGIEWGGGPYYWRIDENNNDGTVSEGGIWSFSVADFIPVEDFESYTDNDAENEAIWQHWIDGFGVPTNGSQAGYLVPPYAEQTIVHGGRQSLPLFYENTGGVTNSEAVLTLTEPRDWTKHDVGALSIWFQGQAPSAGSFTQAGGTFTITATGADIWNQADEFHFAYKTLTGAGEIVAKVESVDNTNAWAKAGVMIRETLDPGSKFAAVYITPGNGCRFQAREDTDIAAVSDTGTETPEQVAITAPYWIKLERDVAGSFRAYYSSNGTSWTPITWRPLVSMESTVFVGLALTSHNNNAVCKAEFSNVTITGTVSPQWLNQDIGIAANDAEPLYVALSNATGTPAVVAHPDPAVANITTWTEWVIPLQDFADKGINLSNVDKLGIGLGTTGGAATGGSGVMYIDDIRLYRPRTP
jgi:hypothetical protein